MRARAGNNLLQNLKVGDPSARQVGRVLNLNETGRRAERPMRADRRLDVLPGQNAALGGYGADQAAGEDRRRRHLEVQNMRPRLGNHLLAGLRQRANRDLVAHGARGHK